MKWDNFLLLNSLLDNLKSEISQFDDAIKFNKNCIEEADKYIASISNDDIADRGSLSSKDISLNQQREISRVEKERGYYEKLNNHLFEKRAITVKRVNQFQAILNEECRNLVVLNMQEEDRQRIARDLHDSSLQNLTYLIHKIELSSLYIESNPNKAIEELNKVKECLRESIDDIRNTIFDLRSMTFDDFGLKAALCDLLDNVNMNNQYIVHRNIEEIQCSTDIILSSIFRLVQECINNIVKHSEASTINFICKQVSNMCEIAIEDDGKGFDLNNINSDGKKHFGISLMRERVELLCGNINIDSQIGKGTKIYIQIPID